MNSKDKISALAITELTDFLDNGENPFDSTATYLSGNLTVPQIHMEDDAKKGEPKTLQPEATTGLQLY